MIDSLILGLFKGLARISDDQQKTELEQLAEIEKWAATAADNLKTMQTSFPRQTAETDEAYRQALARVTGNPVGPAAARAARLSDPSVGEVTEDPEDTRP